MDPRYAANYTIEGVINVVRLDAQRNAPADKDDNPEAYFLALGAMAACDDIRGRIERAEQFKAAVRKQDEEFPDVEEGWVIEGGWSDASEPQYWIGSSAWSGDDMLAIRFARRQDAERAAFMMLDGINIRIACHDWVVNQGADR